jgi:hypothetical protein
VPGVVVPICAAILKSMNGTAVNKSVVNMEIEISFVAGQYFVLEAFHSGLKTDFEI